MKNLQKLQHILVLAQGLVHLSSSFYLSYLFYLKIEVIMVKKDLGLKGWEC